MEKSFRIHSVKYNFIMNIILKMSQFIFPLITFPYVSRVLMAEANGKIAFATSVINYFILIATLGIPTYGVKACAQLRDDKSRLSKTVHELLFINIIFMIISYILFFITMHLIPGLQKNSTLIYISSISIFLATLGVEWFYQAIEQYDYITFRNIAFKLLSIILMFFLVHDEDDFIIYGIINIIGTFGSNILNILRLPKYISLSPFKEYNLIQHLKPIFLLFLYTAATTVYTNLDVIMLGFMSGNLQVGYYNAAVKLKNILVSFVTSLGVVLMPRISYYLNNNMENEFIYIIKKSFSFIFLMSIPLAIYFTFEAEYVIRFLAGTGYIGATHAMQVITPSIIFIGVGSITAWQILIPQGNNFATVIGAVIGGCIDLILNCLLIPKIGATGAAIGTLFAEFSVVIVHTLFLRRIVLKSVFNLETLKIIVCSVLALVSLMVVNYIIIEDVFIKLVLTASLYFSFYFLLLIIFKVKLICEYLTDIKNKIKFKI